jgi:acetyl esterase/lipase
MKINFIEATSEEKSFVHALLQNPKFRAGYSGPETVEAMRIATAAVSNTEVARQAQAGVDIERIVIGGVPCEKLTAGKPNHGKIILFLHGGGFVRGSLDLGRSTAATLAKAAGLDVIAVGYRQAPEFPFPAANEDALSVYRTLLHGGHKAEDIAVVGESSGGCMALTLPTWIAKAGLESPAALAGLSPMIDLNMRGASWHFNRERDFATPAMGALMTDQYIKPQMRDDPLVSPLYGPIMKGGAILLCVGSFEVMLSDVERFAFRTDAENSDVTLNLYEAMPHGFPRFDLKIARQAVIDVAKWCALHLAAG